MNNKTTELYRYFDKSGDLLYIGISLSAVIRQSQHKVASFWYEKAVRCEIERFSTREEALEAEKYAIQTENPKHNVIHNSQEEIKSIDFFEESCRRDKVRLLGKVVVYKPAYTPAEIAEILYGSSTSSAKVRNLIDSQQLQGILISEREQKGNKGQNLVIKKYLITGWHLIDFIEALERGDVSL